MQSLNNFVLLLDLFAPLVLPKKSLFMITMPLSFKCYCPTFWSISIKWNYFRGGTLSHNNLTISCKNWCFLYRTSLINLNKSVSRYCMHCLIGKSSLPKVFHEKGLLRNVVKITGNDLRQRFFFNKVAGLGPGTLSKKRLWHRCFPVNFKKFLRAPFLQNTSVNV